MNFWTTAEVFSPVLCRLLARHKRGGPLTDMEIVKRSGIHALEVLYISQCTTWERIDILDMHKFLVACDLDFEDTARMKAARVYLRRRPTWAYLKRDPAYETFYKPLIRLWLESLKPSGSIV